MRCDQTNLTLDRVYLQGGLYWTGCGNLTITNSVFEGGDSWHVIYAACPTADPAATIRVQDSTLKWYDGQAYTRGSDVPTIWTRSNQSFQILRNLLDGMPQGIDPPGNSLIDSNVIYAVDAPCATGPSHVDGVFSHGGDNITISHNYISVPVASTVTASVFWQNLSGTDTGGDVHDNYLHGGAYTLRNETMIGLSVQGNTFAGGLYGDATTGRPGEAPSAPGPETSTPTAPRCRSPNCAAVGH